MPSLLQPPDALPAARVRAVERQLEPQALLLVPLLVRKLRQSEHGIVVQHLLGGSLFVTSPARSRSPGGRPPCRVRAPRLRS